MSATSGSCEGRSPNNSQRDADLGLSLGAAPVARSADSSLPYGLLWEVCCSCGKGLGVKLGPTEFDGFLSHSYCEPCGVIALGQVSL